MIVPTMTREELYAELSREMAYIEGMLNGISIKYAKQLRIPKSGVLGYVKYKSPRKKRRLSILRG